MRRQELPEDEKRALIVFDGEFDQRHRIPKMLEEVCDSTMEYWTGNIADLQKSAVKVAEVVMKKYVGYYEG